MTVDPASLGIPAHLQTFKPTRLAAMQRRNAINPAAYARTRHALDGAATGLSPYLTHDPMNLTDAPRRLPNPAMACRSFSKFYERGVRSPQICFNYL